MYRIVVWHGEHEIKYYVVHEISSFEWEVLVVSNKKEDAEEQLNQIIKALVAR